MKRAKEELGKAFLNLANLLLVLFLFNTYLQKAHVNGIVIVLVVYSVLSLYWLGFHLIKESSDG